MLDKVKKILNLPLNAVDMASNCSSLDKWLTAIGEENIDIGWTAEILCLFSSKNLRSNQDGYGGLIERQDGSQLVIGHIISDPILIDTSASNTGIFFARHGLGNWNKKLISNTLEEFEQILLVWCEVYYLEFNQSVLNEDYSPKSEFLNSVTKKLLQFLPKSQVENFIYFAE